MNHTGFTLLLPQLDQGALFDKWDFSLCSSSSSTRGIPIAGQQSGLPWEYGRGQLLDRTRVNDSDYKEFLFSTYLGVYHCPSDQRPGLWTYESRGPTHMYAAQNVRRSNYLFATGGTLEVAGDYQEYNRSAGYMQYEPRTKRYEFQGMFGNNGAAEISMVRDGLANSIAIGESVQQAGNEHFGPYWGAGVLTCCHGATPLLAGWGSRRYHINAMHPRYVDPTTGKCTRGAWTRCLSAWAFSSHHPGGAQFVMGDGSVRYLSQSMSFKTFRLLNYIHDGEPVELDD